VAQKIRAIWTPPRSASGPRRKASR